MRQPAVPAQSDKQESVPSPTPPLATDVNAVLIAAPRVPDDLSAAQLAELEDEGKQAEYRRQYLLQLAQRRGCPGCGD